MNVVCFLHSIRGQFAATLAMAARIWKQNRIAVLEQQMSVPSHAFTIIGNSVQQDYGITVVGSGMNKPALERHPISCGNRHILQFSAEISSDGCSNGLLMPQRKTREFETEIGYDDASQAG